MKRVEFWFDYASPYSYLASTQVPALAERTGAEIVWRPFLLGGLFKMVGGPDFPMMTWPEAKRQWALLDMRRHADLYGVPFEWPSRFPINTVNPLRLALAAGESIVPLSRAIYQAFWAEDRDIADPVVLGPIAESVGLPASLVERTREQELKDALRKNTEEAFGKGVFGAPTFLVDGLLFWGQDRLGFVEKAIAGWRPKCG